MSLFKKLVAGLAFTGASAAVIKYVADDKKKRAELDEFLVPSTELSDKQLIQSNLDFIQEKD